MPRPPRPPRFVLPDGSQVLRTRPPGRGGVLASLSSIGFSNPNFVTTFSCEADLPRHLSQRVATTMAKRRTMLAQLYADRGDPTSLNVGGALLQDRRGSSSTVIIRDKSYFTGTQAAHLAIGTYFFGSQPVSHSALQHLQATSRRASRTTHPNLAELVGAGLALDAGTELAPAFVNQSSGQIEAVTMRYMKGLLPVHIPRTPPQLERLLVSESLRTHDLLVRKRKPMIAVIEDRLQSIRRGNAKEIQQSPTDHLNLMFQGKESVFLEAVHAQLVNPSSEFDHLMAQTLLDVPLNAGDMANRAEAAREEIAAGAGS